VTRDPLTHEYALVVKFQNAGNLRRMISENHTALTWKIIIDVLWEITAGLFSTHTLGYYHKDFHSGNILNSISHERVISSVVSDFGMSRPVGEASSDGKTLCGVMPFVAPEVLRGEEYTEAADVYGLGMIMWEILAGEPPFIDREHDENLLVDICINELRPPIPEYAPGPYVTVMTQCWDPIDTNRPTADELMQLFRDWDDQSEFTKAREDQWKARLAERAQNPQPLKQSQNLFTSKRIDYLNGNVQYLILLTMRILILTLMYQKVSGDQSTILQKQNIFCVYLPRFFL